MSQLFETEAVATGRFAQVALEQGVDTSVTGLTYAVPTGLDDLAVGERVMVPLGKANKPVAGYVTEINDHTSVARGRIKAVLSRDLHSVSLTAELMNLAAWMSGYYCCPIGMVLSTMLPAAVKRGTGMRELTQVSLVQPQPTPEGKLSKMQQAVLDTARRLTASGQSWLGLKDLADQAGARTVSPVQQLVAKGLLIAERRMNLSAGDIAGYGGPAVDEAAITLNRAQEKAVESIGAAVGMGFSVHLIHGVTGSGKTEVYLRVMAKAVEGGQGVVMLVPEIALTPQTVRRLIARFGEARVAVLHSGLTPAQRHEQWRRIRAGEADVVVGARSAVFAPLPRLGLIVVDEEHEHSYKQDQLPRYHSRDVAVKRGQVVGVPVILGSATPSLESYLNAAEPPERPRYQLHGLPERVPGLNLPRVEVVDMTDQRRQRFQMTGSTGVHLLSMKLETELRRTLDTRHQAILLLNRRGYANYIACPDHRCGWMMTCENCDAMMVYHRDHSLPAGGVVKCHHCEAEQLLPSICPTCGKKVTVFGLGTQRVEEELSRKLPGVRLLRMDSDVMKTYRDYHDGLESFGRGDFDVLLGTQMISKGLDYPNVRLVGVISADTALHMPDFRASERTFQLISQVAGRAGRGEEPGLVVVQTFSPEDPAIKLAAAHDYEGFASREITLRRDVGLPPVTRMARIVVRDRDAVKCQEQAVVLFGHLTRFDQELGTAVRVRKPAPCPIARIAEYHRRQIEMIAPDAVSLQKLMTTLRNARLLRADAHTAVDVDPVDLM